jgi:putative ABC transport system permease protein
MKNKPPKIATWFLAHLTKVENKFSIIGDAEEDYKDVRQKKGKIIASLWYCLQVFISIIPFLKNSIYWSFAMFNNYLKITIRNLTKHKIYSIINILGLAIGMCAFVLLFQYVNFELSYDAFHENADHIYRIRNDRVYSDVNDKSAGCPPAVGPTIKKEFPEVIESARIYNIDWANTVVTYIAENNSDKNSSGNIVTFNQEKVFFTEPSFLEIFSFPFIQGNPKSALDNPNSAVISKSSAKKYFGNEDPFGKNFILTHGNFGEMNFKITGVFKDVPENSHIKFEFLLSLQTLDDFDNNNANNWGWNAFNTFVLLSHKADPSLLESKFPQMVKKYDGPSKEYTRKLFLQPLRNIHLHSNLRHEPEVNGNAKSVYILIIIALFTLIIAWINFINLSTAKATTRAKEVGMRKVLGSQRNQLIKQFIFDSMFLNIIALIASAVIIKILMSYFNQLIGKQIEISVWDQTGIIIGLIIITGAFLSGIYPAFILSSYNPLVVLKGQLTNSLKGINFRKGLVVFQFVMSIFLITATLIVYKQLLFMRNQDLGMNIAKTVALKTPIFWDNSSDKGRSFKNDLLNYPSITEISLSSTVPGKEYSNAASGIRPLSSELEDGTRCFFIDVDEKYFELYKIPLLAGRNFSTQHKWNESVILNEQAVKVFQLGDSESAINQKIVLGGFDGQIVETIGVVKNFHHKSLKNSLDPIIFNPLRMVKYISIKIEGKDITQTMGHIEKTWKKTFIDQPFEYFFLDESFNNQYKADQKFGVVFGLFAIFAIFVSCLGLFGLISFTTEQRTKEIGIRKVLGSSVFGIIRLITTDYILLILLANLIAWPITYFAMSKWLNNFAYQSQIGILLFGLTGILTMMIALLTVIFKALKSATVNPMNAIKYE